MTPLAQKLIRQIAHTGPMGVAEYFASCLFDPEHGYYTSREPFGRAGDFTTAPEASQMFGELLAVWAWRNWEMAGRPSPFVFAEIGPGRGTMMRDMLRALSSIEGGNFLRAAWIFMIEASPRLRAVQQDKLRNAQACVTWAASLSELPRLPLIIVGNELFDAVPIRQFVRSGGVWRARMVTLGADGRSLAFALGAAHPQSARLPEAPDGEILELAPARSALMAEIAVRIAAQGGAGLFPDYGSLEGGFGDTLQAIRQHSFDPPLAHPGLADLTSHVDFSALAKAAQGEGLETSATTQGDFLLALGLLERAGRLGAGKGAAAQERIRSEVERLACPDQMGQLFKALAVGKPGRLWMPGCQVPQKVAVTRSS